MQHAHHSASERTYREQGFELQEVGLRPLGLLVVVQRDGIVEVEEMVTFHLDRLLVRTAGVLKVIQAAVQGQAGVERGRWCL